jgi:hypothetical protein
MPKAAAAMTREASVKEEEAHYRGGRLCRGTKK